ncbi:Alpha-N-acetylgalactosaminide alpha-2,6-sialyltransferase 5 [Myotis brandtii]|uniref:Alpha-N-acetylgalactosaminide alpha-2,6-sialyltransferase 5 n=1 Tax=Myotis brandtii TaxID=109478 RepID=S7PS18_MYOBR|nr:Alpha-N-acetylgalactosaminide alpha-2,6-sialyltransferase 5 [Myotis brandtii]
MHCRDCALVTSSGHLLRSQQGPQIDQTECVIRMNDAPTRGYGRDVGNRTSLRVIAHSSIQRILRNRHDLLNVSQGTVFIFWGPSSYMRRDGKGQVYNNLHLLSQVLPRLKAFMITRHKMLQFDELFKRETGKDRKISNTWLSTGWFTMTIALELCDRINVYGMVPPDFCRDPNHPSVPYHYYEPFGPDECTMYLSHERGRKGSHHRFITEKRRVRPKPQAPTVPDTRPLDFLSPRHERGTELAGNGFTPQEVPCADAYEKDPNHPSVPYHYYEPFGPDECTMYLSHERGRKGSHHRFITEKRVFKNWARTFNIHFFQPDWKPESLAINHPENKPVF